MSRSKVEQSAENDCSDGCSFHANEAAIIRDKILRSSRHDTLNAWILISWNLLALSRLEPKNDIVLQGAHTSNVYAYSSGQVCNSAF